MSISLRANWVRDVLNTFRILNKKPLDSGVVDWKTLCSSLQLFLIANMCYDYDYKYVLWNIHLFRHCMPLDREDEWCNQTSFFLGGGEAGGDQQCGVADINM